MKKTNFIRNFYTKLYKLYSSYNKIKRLFYGHSLEKHIY
jgi:hypothetical protein